MRFARRSTLLLIVLAALLAGCGGNQIAADEVPVEPPTLTIPSDENAAPGATSADADDQQEDEDADADADATATATAEPGTTTGGTTGGTTGATTGAAAGTTGGGTSAEPTATAAPPEDTGGAAADEGLDQFCADNPGAC